MGRKAEPLYFQAGEEICTPQYGPVVINKLLGRGAFAQCFLVQTKDGRLFALKVIDHVNVTKKGLREKIENERVIHRALHHPHIVSLFDDFKNNQYTFLLLEYCEHGGLDLFVKKQKPSLNETKNWVKQVISALKYLHFEHATVHRDLKLGNLFLDTNFNIKLGDFGLAAVLASDTKKRTLCGTPNYIAPEVIFAKEKGHSFAVDVWAVGVVLYTLLVGVPPFQKGSLAAIYEHIRTSDFAFPDNYNGPRYSRDLVTRILTPDPLLRPSLDEILNHKFFLRQMNTVESMFFHLSNKDYITGNIDMDHVIFTLPVSRCRGIGYCQASGLKGMYFHNNVNLALKNCGTYVLLHKMASGKKTVIKKEEFQPGCVPSAYAEHEAHLKHFATHYCSEMPITVSEHTYVLKVKKIQNTIILCCYNGVMQFDFSGDVVVVLANEGKNVSCFSDNGQVEFTDDLRNKCLKILSVIK